MFFEITGSQALDDFSKIFWIETANPPYLMLKGDLYLTPQSMIFDYLIYLYLLTTSICMIVQIFN